MTGRPRLEIRDALLKATHELVAQRRAEMPLDTAPMVGVSWREAAQHAQVGHEVARQTMNNLARAGELSRVHRATQPGARRPMTLYAPAPQPEESDDVPPLLLLDDVMRGWLPAPAGS